METIRRVVPLLPVRNEPYSTLAAEHVEPMADGFACSFEGRVFLRNDEYYTRLRKTMSAVEFWFFGTCSTYHFGRLITRYERKFAIRRGVALALSGTAVRLLEPISLGDKKIDLSMCGEDVFPGKRLTGVMYERLDEWYKKKEKGSPPRPTKVLFPKNLLVVVQPATK